MMNFARSDARGNLSIKCLTDHSIPELQKHCWVCWPEFLPSFHGLLGRWLCRAAEMERHAFISFLFWSLEEKMNQRELRWLVPRHYTPLLRCAHMRQNALTSRRLPASLGTAGGSNSTANSLCTGNCLHCPVHLAVSQSCSFRTQNSQTQCELYMLPALLLLPFVSPHLHTWCVSPSVVGGIMICCQAEPISCPLW